MIVARASKPRGIGPDKATPCGKGSKLEGNLREPTTTYCVSVFARYSPGKASVKIFLFFLLTQIIYNYQEVIEFSREISLCTFDPWRSRGKSTESQDIVVHSLFTICPIESPLDIQKRVLAGL
jgi:hypothetical protein